MTDEPESWRTEIEEVLKEIASDPKARLLRIPPVKNLLALANQGPVSVHAPSLTTAERYLLATHRQELAFLLRERCVMELHADPRTNARHHTSLTADRDYEIPTERDWSRRATEALSSDLEGPSFRDALDALSACVGTRPGGGASVAQLASSSIRVAPSYEAQMYIAEDLLDRGRIEESRGLYEEVLASTGSELLQVFCWENIGVGCLQSNRRNEAVIAYRTACELGSRQVSPPLPWFAAALAAGDEKEATEAARFIDQIVPSGHPLVSMTVHALSEIVCARDKKRVARMDFEGIGEEAARILHVFQS